MKKFNEYKKLDLPALSKEVLAQWEKENLFEKSVSTREGHPQFLFFEGPPSANGMPGIHHVMARTIKDTWRISARRYPWTSTTPLAAAR